MSSELCYPHPALSVRILQSFLCEGRLPLPMCSAVPTPVTACGRERLFTSSRSRLLPPQVPARKPFLPRSEGSATLFICPKLQGESVPRHKHLAGGALQQGS